MRALQPKPTVVTLALDSTASAGSLAVSRDGQVLAARAGDPSRPHGQRLPGDVLALLDEAGIRLQDVTLYAVASGPGAFTGLRIGIACIQGFAFAHGRPVVGISALDALASGGATSAGLNDGARVGAWMDAARHEVFAALYRVELREPGTAPVLHLAEPPSVGPAATIVARWHPQCAGRPTWLVGEGAVRYWSVAEAAGAPFALIGTWPPIAAAMIPLAEAAAERGLAGPPHAVRPLYVRRPDAEIARDRRAAPDAAPR